MTLRNLLFFAFFLSVSLATAQSSASKNITIFELPAPQLDTLKKIRLYLPGSYKTSEKKYPVIYMHDAQNLFDNETSYAGEWAVDEFLDSLAKKEVIVVGIDHGGDKRIGELTPFKNEKYGGGNAEAYLKFLTQILKPYIDSKYRTLPGYKHTGIFGSSLGGLVSFYAGLRYPDTFSKIGVYSPSFWFSDNIYSYAEETPLNPQTKFYFLAGTEEGEEVIPDIEKMIGILQKKGLKEENYQLKIVEDGKHNEKLWRDSFPETFEWLEDYESL
ncbi:alpha/beta hydrolase [Salegentibacter chungangensis]|uniref:Alpha/beta hydrolase n=1 Tax=Salegentibacter chungangensis TaxID=1335724 RepID=A0ABW3NRE1_9FLAO